MKLVTSLTCQQTSIHSTSGFREWPSLTQDTRHPLKNAEYERTADCKNFFNKIITDKDDKRYKLLPFNNNINKIFVIKQNEATQKCTNMQTI